MTRLQRERRHGRQHFFVAMHAKRSSTRRKGSERRRRGRHATAIPAKLLLPQAPPIACTIVALSTEGARLALRKTSNLPVTLRMRAAGKVYYVETAQRAGDHLFVKFRPRRRTRHA